MEQDEKVRENRARRAAERQGLRLEKSRARDPRALGYGTYQIVIAEDGQIRDRRLKSGYGMTLNEVEARLMLA